MGSGGKLKRTGIMDEPAPTDLAAFIDVGRAMTVGGSLAGDVYWDCQYHTFAACYPNALADRGFCNVNPWPGPPQVVPYKHWKRHVQY